jgi:hypothetical protein
MWELILHTSNDLFDYLRQNAEHLNAEQIQRIVLYVESLEPIIVQNMTRQAQEVAFKMRLEAIMSQAQAPLQTGQTNTKRATVAEQVEPDPAVLPETGDINRLTK